MGDTVDSISDNKCIDIAFGRDKDCSSNDMITASSAVLHTSKAMGNGEIKLDHAQVVNSNVDNQDSAHDNKCRIDLATESNDVIGNKITKLVGTELNFSDSIADKRYTNAVSDSSTNHSDDISEVRRTNGCANAGPAGDVGGEITTNGNVSCQPSEAGDNLSERTSNANGDCADASGKCDVKDTKTDELDAISCASSSSAKADGDVTIDRADELLQESSMLHVEVSSEEFIYVKNAEANELNASPTEKADAVVTAIGTNERPNESSIVQNEVSSPEVVILSASSSLSTVARAVMRTSSLPSESSAPLLPSSSKAVTRSTTASTASLKKQINQSQPLPVHSSNVRPISKILQDVGMMLTSQRVFKDLVRIQKKKISIQQQDSAHDTEMLEKLRVNHRNLAAKNRVMLMGQRRCWCGYLSESANVIEAHRLLIYNAHGRCCYCHGEFVYRTTAQIKKHLLKAHGKVGKSIGQCGLFLCPFCPAVLPTRVSLMQHKDKCQLRFCLATNLAPKDSDKDIPVSPASRRPVKVPVDLSTAQSTSSATPALQTLSNVFVSSSCTTVSSLTVVPSINLGLPSVVASKQPASTTQLVRIGKQLFAVVPQNAAVTPAVAASIPVKPLAGVATSLTTTAVTKAQISRLPTYTVPKTPNILRSNQTANVSTPVLQYSVCPVCNGFVKDTPSLLIHMAIAHGSTHKLCQYCRNPTVTFSTATELNLHIMKSHTSDCWICRGRFQPPDELITHLADRHKVTMAKMLELNRCYLCSSVPHFSKYAHFEQHMLQMHYRQCPNATKLWDYIIRSPDAYKNVHSKQNADGTLECIYCHGYFVSPTFLYRHLYLEHDGPQQNCVKCSVCKRSVPSAVLLDHLVSAHTRSCSVCLRQVDMAGAECIFIPPAGTRVRRKRKKLPALKICDAKSIVPDVTETVIISDDDDDDDNNDADERDGNDGEEECWEDCGDKNFELSHKRLRIEPQTHRLRSASKSRRNSSLDDVHEVLESIVHSDKYEGNASQSVSSQNKTTYPVNLPTSVQLYNGISDDEAEIIESIVPAMHGRRKQQLGQIESTTKVSLQPNSISDEKSCNRVKSVNNCDKSDLELTLTECSDSNFKQASNTTKSPLVEISAQQLMARNQINMTSIEEVMEVDGETVLIVHDDDDDNDS